MSIKKRLLYTIMMQRNNYKYHNILAVFCLCFFITSCKQSLQNYNDVKDYGLNGKVKKQEVINYTQPVEKFGEWGTQDSIAKYIITKTFDKTGLLTETIQQGTDMDNKRMYTIENGQKTQSIYFTGSEKTNVSKFTYSNSSIIEKEYRLDGKLSAEIISILDKDKKVKEEYIKNYTKDGNLDNDTKSILKNDKDGFLSHIENYDLLTNRKRVFDFTVLKKDDKGNPTKILKIVDTKPFALQILTYEYY
jgi:hypothetical protein